MRWKYLRFTARAQESKSVYIHLAVQDSGGTNHLFILCFRFVFSARNKYVLTEEVKGSHRRRSGHEIINASINGVYPHFTPHALYTHAPYTQKKIHFQPNNSYTPFKEIEFKILHIFTEIEKKLSIFSYRFLGNSNYRPAFSRRNILFLFTFTLRSKTCYVTISRRLVTKQKSQVQVLLIY